MKTGSGAARAALPRNVMALALGSLAESETWGNGVFSGAGVTNWWFTSVYRYGPYGEPDTWTGSRFRYTGQIALPEVSLYHYKARVYDPILGRFLQTDPVGYETDLNLYQYVRNDPPIHVGGGDDR